jgi:excinuclease UvrABC nuclease subunit
LFYGKNDLPLYVVKSTHIKQRVLSHFSADHRHNKEISLSQQLHRIEYIEKRALSAHADQNQLLTWANHFKNPKPRLYLIHGEKTACLSLQTCFNRMDWPASIPKVGEQISF